MRRTLGLDVGGAGLKGSILDASGTAIWTKARRFPLWKHPERLADELTLLIDVQPFTEVALTMTGELCDAFETKAEGVHAIITATKLVAQKAPVWVWQTAGSFAPAEIAATDPWSCAASNWVALADYVARLFPRGMTLLIDIGSTTTDIIPIQEGRLLARGRTDPERLIERELLYRGIRRTPLAAMMKEVVLNGDCSLVMAELFAATLDAYLIEGAIPEDPNDRDTADGRPATRIYALRRLARMVGSDETRFSESDAREWAAQVKETQIQETESAVQAVLGRQPSATVDQWIISGEGEWLAKKVIDRIDPAANVVSLAEVGSADLSRGACAWGVAYLLQQYRPNAPPANHPTNAS